MRFLFVLTKTRYTCKWHWFAKPATYFLVAVALDEIIILIKYRCKGDAEFSSGIVSVV